MITDEERATVPEKRNPAPVILGAVVLLLAVYYVVIGALGVLETTTRVDVRGAAEPADETYLTLQMRVQDVDLTNRAIEASILPVPNGGLEGERAGEIARALRIEMVSGGITTSVVTFPGDSIIDPTSMTLSLDRGDTAYPFDQPFAALQLSVQDDETGDAVPFVIDMSNSARPWVLSAQLGEAREHESRVLYPITIDGNRDVLSIALVGFYVLAILVTTLMAVVTIGSAILTKSLEFANVIWLSATLLSFPALRSAMPGAPPIGTAMDFLVLFPCLVLVAGMLVWTGAHLLWRESHVLRRRTLAEQQSPVTADAPTH